MKVTKEHIEEMVKSGVITHHPIKGIPDGLSFFRPTERKIDNLFQAGHLIAYKIGCEQMSYKPIIYLIDATDEEIKKEYAEAEVELLKHYKELN